MTVGHREVLYLLAARRAELPGWFLARPLVLRPRLRLVCLPDAGGGATLFVRWARTLPPGVELRAAELGGGDGIDLDAVIVELAGDVMTWPRAPTVFCGQGAGALLALALAQRLRATLPLVRLVVSGQRAPHAEVAGWRCRDGAPLACPIVALAGEGDADITDADLDAWRDQTRAPFRWRRVPGDHHHLLAEDGPLVAEALGEARSSPDGPGAPGTGQAAI